ncbi:CocE/NonD family hydrolase [Myxococcota bacterium]|nr:CocE/NonD family hydrolase [Myxococcota bacterium]
MNHRRRVALGISATALMVLTSCFFGRFELVRRVHGLPDFTHSSAGSEVQWVTTRDGVRLHTEVFRPKGLEKAPTVLIRNPYDAMRVLERTRCGVLSRYGYACVLQDVRGRIQSEGDWVPLIHERNDGLDTLDWLVNQPFVDGNIGMMGPSYLAWTQWAVADALPPEVKTIMPSVFGVELYSANYERGLFRHDVITAWAALMPHREMRMGAAEDYWSAATHRPAIEADVLYLEGPLAWYRALLESPAPSDPYWTTPPVSPLAGVPPAVKVPVFMVGGLFDPFLVPQLKAFEALGSRAESVLILGPWNHLGQVSDELSAPEDTGGLFQWALSLEWLDHTLRGAPLRSLRPGEVRLLGPDEASWRSVPVWPDPAAAPRTWALADASAAQGCDGGALLPGAEAPLSETDYVYNPDDPNPTRGGASLLSFAFFPKLDVTPGPVEQGLSCDRPDVLTFKSPPLDAPTRLSGVATLTLTVRSTAPDTAFVARIIVEDADGQAHLIREAAATLAFPDEATVAAQSYTPGEERALELSFWPMEWALPAGARLRVDLSSSSFPALHNHNNRAGPWAAQTGADLATQTVLVGEGRAVLTLPIAP